MAKKRNEPEWTSIDPNTLQPEAREAYETLQQANDAQKAARKNFERAFSDTADASSTHRVLFSYQAGGFSVVVEPFKRKRVKTKPVHFDQLKANVKKKR